MRIIGGTHGGRKIQPPSNMPHTRPTTDIAKEGLFNILGNLLDFEDLKTLDLFGGTGSITYELASRGATEQVIVEQDMKMHAFIKERVNQFGFQHIQVLRSEVFRFMENCKNQYDFIFAGPPYALGTIDELPDRVFTYDLLNSDGIFVLEHTPRNSYTEHEFFFREKNYGTTVFSFFRKKNA